MSLRALSMALCAPLFDQATRLDPRCSAANAANAAPGHEARPQMLSCQCCQRCALLSQIHLTQAHTRDSYPTTPPPSKKSESLEGFSSSSLTPCMSCCFWSGDLGHMKMLQLSLAGSPSHTPVAMRQSGSYPEQIHP